MSKGLEATKRLKWGLDITHEERINLCECIEKELKEKEELDIMYSNCVIEGAKQKKALEIIKTNRKLCKFIIFELEDNHTTEETELLKEVLL